MKVELLKVDKSDEPTHKIIVDMISANRINKLVMGLTFFKSSSWYAKDFLQINTGYIICLSTIIKIYDSHSL